MKPIVMSRRSARYAPLVLLAMLLACGGGGDDGSTPTGAVTGSSQTSGGGDADPAEAPSEIGVSYETKRGIPLKLQLGGDIQVPEAVKSLPLYPNAKPIKAFEAGPEGTATIFESSDDPMAIRQFFLDKLGEQGWRVEDGAGTPRIVARKDGRKATVVVTSGGVNTRINIVLEGG